MTRAPKVALGVGACGDPERPELSHADWTLLPAKAAEEVKRDAHAKSDKAEKTDKTDKGGH